MMSLNIKNVFKNTEIAQEGKDDYVKNEKIEVPA